MKIHSICVVKDESDIIEQTLRSAAVWSDNIYVLDNGSKDGTWEKILELSQKCKCIIPYKQDLCIYHNGLRAKVFHEFSKASSPGDWWCQLDADEIYIDNPRVFLAKIPLIYQSVWGASFTYYFTDQDFINFQKNPGFYADEVPVFEKCRFYRNDWSEARFFRFDPDLVWQSNKRWPYTGAVYPVRIWLRHYQYRSPKQIKTRISNRLQARLDGSKSFHHLKVSNEEIENSSFSELVEKIFRKMITSNDTLYVDNNDSNYVSREDLMPKLPSFNPYLSNSTRTLKRYVNRMTFQKIFFLEKSIKSKRV